MKKTFRVFGMLLCAIFMAVGFTSCSDDDDDEPKDSSIVGTWLYTEEDEDGDGYWYVQLNIKSNGTVNSKEWWSEEADDAEYYSGTWSVAGDRLTVIWEDDEDDEPWTGTYRFVIDGNKLTLYGYEGYAEKIVFVRK